MLAKIHIQNYRLLRDVVINIPENNPVVLIGPNASGKSTYLEVLDLLSSAANGFFGEALQRRGGFRSIYSAYEMSPQRDDRDVSVCVQIRPRSGWLVENDQGLVTYRLSFHATSQNRVVISREDIEIAREKDSGPLCVMQRQGGEVFLLNRTTGKRDKLSIAADSLALSGVQQSEFYPTVSNVREVLGKIRVYPGFLTLPLWAKDPRENDVGPRLPQYLVQTPQISSRGFDLITALHYLETEHRDTAWVELKKNLWAEFPSIQDLILQADAGGGRMALAYKDVRFPRVKFYAEQMSEGTVDYLCLLAALFSPEPTACIAFDEPDARLHPSAIRRLVSLMERRAQTTTVFVTTHSNDILDNLAEPYESVFVCEAVGDPSGVAARKLNPEEFDEWRKLYSLSQLRGKNYIDLPNRDSVAVDK